MSPATTHASVLRGSDSPCSSSIRYVITPTRSSFKPKMRIPKGAVSHFCSSILSPKPSFWFLPARIRVFSVKPREPPSLPGIVRGMDRSYSGSDRWVEGRETKQVPEHFAVGGDCIWSSFEGRNKIAIGKQIFCNRSLNMKGIVAVGFDMDYTLAQYKPETFETLAYNGTVRKLVYDLGYPPELLEWTFDWKYMVRGLVLDKKRGNILKMDRHKYVKVAYHGFKEMSKEEKIATYGNTLIRDSFDEPDYALIDTLFSLAEAYLFAQLVDFKDSCPGKVPNGADYCRIYKDVRAAVDLCHRDGTLKQMVAKDPGKYINEDQLIVPMLKMLRDSGRATFLVTNSLWDYTDVVMNFLCRSGTTDSPCDHFWLENFDVVITGSAKPGFFNEDNRANLFEVEPDTGMLLNTDNGTLVPQVGNVSPRLPIKGLRKGCRVFQGGSVAHLHKLLSIEASSQVLYVGDHIYGDILRSKKVLGWRTMLVVPELAKEIEMLWATRDIRKELRLLRKDRDFIEDKIHHLSWSLRFKKFSDEDKPALYLELHALQSQREQVRHLHQQSQRECHQKFHKPWGQLMKTGYQNSRFAHQVERFACLYTSQVTNIGFYSPNKYYRPSEDFMPHEFDILGLGDTSARNVSGTRYAHHGDGAISNIQEQTMLED